MTAFLKSIRKEGAAEHRHIPYSKVEEQTIINRALSSDNARHESGILKQHQYYKGFFSFVRYGNVWLKYNEFESLGVPNPRLFKSGWIDMELIEFYLRLKLPIFKTEHNVKSSTQILSLRNTQHLFFNPALFSKIKPSIQDKFKDSSTNYLIMPVLKPNHYFAIIIDQVNRKFYFMDSGSDNGNERTAKSLMNRYVNRTKTDIQYEAIAVKVQEQGDTNSCGLFAIHNILWAIVSLASQNKIVIPNIGDKNRKRQEMMEEILQLSDNITNICPKCYKEADPSIICIYCQKNVHDECSKVVGSVISPSGLICFECANFLFKK